MVSYVHYRVVFEKTDGSQIVYGKPFHKGKAYQAAKAIPSRNGRYVRAVGILKITPKTEGERITWLFAR